MSPPQRVILIILSKIGHTHPLFFITLPFSPITLIIIFHYITYLLVYCMYLNLIAHVSCLIHPHNTVPAHGRSSTNIDRQKERMEVDCGGSILV